MGHAHLGNLSRFFVNRLYAKGKLSLREAAEAAARAGERLEASEHAYEEAHSIALGFVDIIDMLSSADPAGKGYGGFQPNAGPWIVPDLSVWQGKRSLLRSTSILLLRRCVQNPDDQTLLGMAADSVEEDGQQEWAAFLRLLPRMHHALEAWFDPNGDIYADELDDGWTVFDHIPWRFAPGWRNRYREVPLLGSVTH